jgi:hypothetical protein
MAARKAGKVTVVRYWPWWEPIPKGWRFVSNMDRHPYSTLIEKVQ